jgi:hypothetical protein
MENKTTRYYLQVLPPLLVIIKHKESAVVAPFDIGCLNKFAYLTLHGPPLPGVVVQLKSAHNDPNEVKNAVSNLLHQGPFEAIGKGYAAIQELNQTVKNGLEQRRMPNH